MPETNIDDKEREKLLRAADYLYETIWEDFKSAFELNFDSLLVNEGVRASVFASFRGLVLSADGYGAKELDESGRLARRKSCANRGSEPFDSFKPGDNEPNYVLKAYWPFIRRTTRWADFKEFVACGVMDWRALYVTALGARKLLKRALTRPLPTDSAPKMKVQAAIAKLGERASYPKPCVVSANMSHCDICSSPKANRIENSSAGWWSG